MNISHTALWVSEYEETKRFYIETLGLDQAQETVDGNGVYNLYLTGSSDTELQFKYDPDKYRNVSTDAIDHIAFDTTQLDEMFQVIRDEFGTKVVMEPTTRETRRGYQATIALVEDPTGYTVELVERHSQ